MPNWMRWVCDPAIDHVAQKTQVVLDFRLQLTFPSIVFEVYEKQILKAR